MSILVVDDSPIDRRLASGLLTRAGFTARLAENGHEALTSLEAERADLVVTDLVMPEMDGLTLVEAICSRYADIPVILMTGGGSEDIAVRALQRGAASYVPKRDLARSLVETVRSILSVRELDESPLSVRAQATMRWDLGNDLREVTAVVRLLETRLAGVALVDESSRIQISVALREAIVNAMLHGNLGLSSELKESDVDAHDALAEERRKLSPYRERRVRVTVRETPDDVTYVVSDDGPGFDLGTVPDPTDPANLERTSGRGLFLIRTFMDDVTHTDGGRTITMVKRRR
ncbi:MAG TPA: response regulator [Labilithrix sp.]|nr:response regulator [Labilithrix sp.]